MKTILIIILLNITACAPPEKAQDAKLILVQAKWLDLATAQVLDLTTLKIGLDQGQSDAVFNSGSGASKVECKIKVEVNGDNRSGQVYVVQPALLKLTPTTADSTPCEWLKTFYGYEIIGSTLRVFVGLKTRDYVLMQ